jgi:hypothetical protein
MCHVQYVVARQSGASHFLPEPERKDTFLVCKLAPDQNKYGQDG